MSETRGDVSRYLRTELLERIAHELRGPAGVTLGALDELEHSLGSDTVEQNRMLFAMARRGARRVLRTAERLARTALLESASPHISPVPSDVRAIVKQASEDAELTEGRSSVRVKLNLPEQPCLCEADGGWLSVALSELVSQAIRCARREVEVNVECGASLTIRVSDDRTVVMEPPPDRFVALDDRRDAALGWPLVCDVARAHGGNLVTEPQHSAAGAVTGYRVTLSLRAARQ
jgi:signal transduction histidine kinase